MVDVFQGIFNVILLQLIVYWFVVFEGFNVDFFCNLVKLVIVEQSVGSSWCWGWSCMCVRIWMLLFVNFLS